jgi:transposase
LLPLQRTCEVLQDLCHAQVSQASVVNWITQAAKGLAPTMERLKELLLWSQLQHVDETGIRVKGRVRWVHVNATRWLTRYHWHPKRGAEAIDDIGILPRFAGRAMHDRWTSYDRYPCTHSLCGAHLLRDCISVAEQEKQPWAQEMHDHFLDMLHVTKQWRAQGARFLPKEVHDCLLAKYFAILASGFKGYDAAQAQAPPRPKKAGHQKQDPSKNLLDALLLRAEQVLGFVDDLSVPFTNNQAERDLRMIKVQQKVSGTFRRPEGTHAFCIIRSYLSTMRKQGRSMLEAMAAVFVGSPFPIAWAPE